MKFRIDDKYEIDSNDITKLTFKLSKINNKGGTNSTIAFFSSIDGMKPYILKYYPELMNDKLVELINEYENMIKITNNKELNGKHSIKFYFDDFYFVEFVGDTYIMYTHPVLNGAPGSDNSKIIPNVDRQKVVCYPSNLNCALLNYCNQYLRDSDLENSEFLDEVKNLSKNIVTKIQSLIDKINTKVEEKPNEVTTVN